MAWVELETLLFESSTQFIVGGTVDWGPGAHKREDVGIIGISQSQGQNPKHCLFLSSKGRREAGEAREDEEKRGGESAVIGISSRVCWWIASSQPPIGPRAERCPNSPCLLKGLREAGQK